MNLYKLTVRELRKYIKDNNLFKNYQYMKKNELINKINEIETNKLLN